MKGKSELRNGLNIYPCNYSNYPCRACTVSVRKPKTVSDIFAHTYGCSISRVGIHGIDLHSCPNSPLGARTCGSNLDLRPTGFSPRVEHLPVAVFSAFPALRLVACVPGLVSFVHAPAPSVHAPVIAPQASPDAPPSLPHALRWG